MPPTRALVALLLAIGLPALAIAASKPPNFIVIITDDQDATQNSTHPRYMPNLHKWIRYPGVELDNYYVTTPVCCPSRTNWLRGQFAHNTNFTDVLAPHGGYKKWKSLGIDNSYLPGWLQDLGYNTYYVGKFLVDYSVTNYADKPKGWTDIDALLTPYMFDYNNPGFSRNGAAPVQYPGQYSNDVVGDKALAQLRTAIAAGKPFFHQISPIAPHTSTQFFTNPETNLTSVFFYPPIPAPRHWELFSDATLPQGTPQGNLYEKDVSDKPAWIRALPLAQQNNRTYLEEIYRLRLRSLFSVDEIIGRVFNVLNETGTLDNTYVIYTADNGYHVATHRFGAGKVLPYEEEIRVPFLIRGPGIKASKSDKPENHKVGLHVDFAPTVLTLAGAGKQLAGKELDGTPLGIYDNDDGTLRADYPRPKYYRNQFQAEFWGRWSDELLHHLSIYANNTWKAVRVHDEAKNRDWKLIASCTNERELYDLTYDRGELRNIYAKADKRVRSRLEGLLAVLAVCRGESCSNPWKVLHPSGEVQSWAQALQGKYDSVYDDITPFRFKNCLPYQVKDNEVSQFRAQIDAAAAKGRRRDLASGAAAAASNAAAGTTSSDVVFIADVEKHARPVPQEVLDLDIGKLFENYDIYLA
ncbi:hypothetical protein HYH03_006078 [Edaphochlamys debaryana]|uniref:Arylsulfatase n=1 Tax=Edaphochlamys debaryana TaxID=47281 RepID=A0A835Y634_9CHLO|nr:hypothetical protein HYH03_006078 [Edaphochlamys debaryana]|eukprot:KAG2495839.1 hypothetical protein HYH03_006078 [Edaphochlamys debaryana]